MVPLLIACAACQRHVFARETKCPFCHASLGRPMAMGVMALTAGLMMGACEKSPTPSATTPDVPVHSSTAVSVSDAAIPNTSLGTIDAATVVVPPSIDAGTQTVPDADVPRDTSTPAVDASRADVHPRRDAGPARVSHPRVRPPPDHHHISPAYGVPAMDYGVTEFKDRKPRKR